ncbi:MAG: hypothetical protein ACRDMV_18220 [Streptosporangiales bacterium]
MSAFAEYREQRRYDRAADEQRRQDAADRAAQRRCADAAAAASRRATRRTERHETHGERVASLRELGMSVLWATMIVLPVALAWTAQAQFAADTLAIPEPFNQGFPAAIECGAWLCAFEAHRRGRRGEPVGSLPRYMWALALVAATINAAHGLAHGLAAGLALGVLSLLGLALHSIRQRLDTAHATGGPVRVGLACWRRLRYPRLSIAAASLRAARELDAATAWRLAWIDQYGVGPDATRRDRRLAHVIVSREAREDRKAARDGRLTVLAGRVQYTFGERVRSLLATSEQGSEPRQATRNHPSAESASIATSTATPVVRDSATTPVPEPRTNSSELGERAAELLPVLRESITAERVPANPSVRRIREWARAETHESIGTPTAQQLRDAVAAVRLIEPAREVS